MYANRFLKRECYVIASACFKGLAVIYENQACARSPRTSFVLCSGMIPGLVLPKCFDRSCTRSGCYLILKGDPSEDVILHIENCCLTNPSRSFFRYFFANIYVSLIHQVVAGNKEKSVLLFCDSLVKLFSLKSDALFKKAETLSSGRDFGFS